MSVQAEFFTHKRVVAKKCPDNPWTLPANLIFSRVDRFLERARFVRRLLETITQFFRFF